MTRTAKERFLRALAGRAGFVPVPRALPARRRLIQRLLAAQGGLCALCGKPVEDSGPHYRSATLDHIIPLSRRGMDTTDNVQAAHHDCNQKKGAKIRERKV